MPRKKTASNGNDIRFTAPREGASECLLAEAEVVIEAGILAGMTLTGIQVWRRKESAEQTFVTFPGRGYESNGKQRRWEYLRASDQRGETAKAIRQSVLAAWRAKGPEKEVTH